MKSVPGAAFQRVFVNYFRQMSHPSKVAFCRERKGGSDDEEI